MYSFFKNSFKIKNILLNKSANGIKILFYFIFLVLLVSFPFNFQTIKHKGFNINSISTGLEANVPSWFPDRLSSDLKFTKTGVVGLSILDNNLTFNARSGNNENFKIVFNPTKDYKCSGFTILIYEKEIVLHTKKNETLKGNYNNIDEFSVKELKDLTANNKNNEAIKIFANFFEKSFQSYFNFYSIIMNFLLNLLINFLLVITLSLILCYLRINHKKVTSFKENIRIVISSMTIPSMISFIFGLIFVSINQYSITSFSAVLFQFLTPIIALIAIRKGSNEKEILTKGL